MGEKKRWLANARRASDVNPTLWRTCRALAHCERLRVFQLMMRRGALCVGEAAVLLDLPLNLASELCGY